MEDSTPLAQQSAQSTSINTQQSNNSDPNSVPASLSSRKKIIDLSVGIIGTIIVYGIVAQLWRKIAYAVFAPSLAASGADFPGIIFFAYIAIIPVFVVIAIVLWKSRRNLAIGIFAGAVLTTLYFFVRCSITLAPGGCLGLLT